MPKENLPPNPRRPSDATGTMSIMCKHGDSKFHWNKKDPQSVAAAKEVFDAHQGKGYLAFSMNAKGDQGEQMRQFDPEAESVLFMPQMQGG